MKIGIIGGTGPQGKGIAMRFALNGIEIIIGSRSKERAETISKELNLLINGSNITGMSNSDVIKSSEILFLTIPFETVNDTLIPLIDDIKEYCKIFVDVTVPMHHEKGKGMVYVQIPEGNMSKSIQKLVDPVPVVAAFKTIGSHALLDIKNPLERDTFVLGSKENRESIIEIISNIKTLRPINAGPLREVETVERLVPFLINVNRRYKIKDSGLKVVM